MASINPMTALARQSLRHAFRSARTTPSAALLRSGHAAPARTFQTCLARRSPSSAAATTPVQPQAESVPEKVVLPEIQGDERKVSIRWQDGRVSKLYVITERTSSDSALTLSKRKP